MSVDLLILDDDKIKLDLVARIADEYNLTSIKFTRGYGVKEYLDKCVNGSLPLGYMIDMRIPDEDDNISKDIFYLLEDKFKDIPGRMNYFRFFTGHWSSHDGIVEEETRAIVIVKGGDVVPALREYMQLLKTEKERIKVQSSQ